jgi:hypothetical protein
MIKKVIPLVDNLPPKTIGAGMIFSSKKSNRLILIVRTVDYYTGVEIVLYRLDVDILEQLDTTTKEFYNDFELFRGEVVLESRLPNH